MTPIETPCRTALAARSGDLAPVACATNTVVPIPTDINPLKTTKKDLKRHPRPGKGSCAEAASDGHVCDGNGGLQQLLNDYRPRHANDFKPKGAAGRGT